MVFLEDIVYGSTLSFIQNYNLRSTTPQGNRNFLLQMIVAQVELENMQNKNKICIKPPQKLNKWQIAMLILNSNIIVNINFKNYLGPNDSSETMKLAIYMESGEHEGTYVTNEDVIDNLIMQYQEDISERGVKDVKFKLRKMAPTVLRCANPDLVPVKNGVFDFKTKTLWPFSPDLVFTYKFPVDYNPNAVNPVFTNPDGTTWDIESWMQELSDDPAVVNLLWEVVGAIIRPYVSWNKIVWLYSSSGNSGKGTLCCLLRHLCGAGNHASITAENFSQRFGLANLITAMSVINDENAVGFELGKTNNLKAVTTGDVISIEEKFKNAFDYQFRGLIVQCINSLPRTKDTSESFYRRQLLVPFDKCFTGKERKYIKEVYLKDKGVLEYVMCKVLHMTHYEFSQPTACRELLEISRSINNPIHSFWVEMENEFAWDVLPMKFLYEIFKGWYQEEFNHLTNISEKEFKQFFREKSQVDPAFMNGWRYEPQKNGRNKSATKVNSAMAAPEPLIAKFNLTEWMNPTYRGSDINRMCTCLASLHSETYKGALVRVSSSSPALPVVDDDDDETEEESD